MTAQAMKARRGETRSGSMAKPRQRGPQDAPEHYPDHAAYLRLHAKGE